MIDRDPREARLYAGRAGVWASLGELDIAISDYNEAIRLSPEAAAYNGRGLIWDAQGEFDKAISDYDEAMRLDPKRPHRLPQSRHGVAQKGRTRQSDRGLYASAGFRVEIALTYSNRGFAWSSKGEFDKAIEDFNQALELDPKLMNAYNDRGLAWVNKGEYDHAIANYDECSSLIRRTRSSTRIGP